MKKNNVAPLILIAIIVIVVLLVGNVLSNQAGNKAGALKNDQNEKIGDMISDGVGGTVPVPEGFYYVGGTISTGIVISDDKTDQNKYKGKTDVGVDLNGNQYVWVPCSTTNESGSIQYAQDKDFVNYHYDEYVDWKEKADVKANTASVEKYGGFYVGRYEAGVPSNASFYADSDGDEYLTTQKSKEDNLKPVSKANNQIWNYITQIKASEVSSNIYEENVSVRSSLIDSYAWDTIVEWMSTDVDVTNSTGYGIYSDADFKVEDTLYAYHLAEIAKDGGPSGGWILASKYNKGDITLGEEIPNLNELYPENDTVNYEYAISKEVSTGAVEETKVKNIYDMAGSMWEWTTEQGNHETLEDPGYLNIFGVVRGGSINNHGYEIPVIIRNGAPTTDFSVFNYGFRVVLYIEN